MSADGAGVWNVVWSFWVTMGECVTAGSVMLTDPAWAGSAIANIPA